jgi:hypothetical protein
MDFLWRIGPTWRVCLIPRCWPTLGGSSPGVFLVKQHAPIAEVIDALVLVWAASDADEWRDRIVEIPAP